MSCSQMDGAWEASLHDVLLFHSLSPLHRPVVSPSMPLGCSTRGERLAVGPSKKQKQSRRTAAGVVRRRLALAGVDAPHPPTYNQPAADIPKVSYLG